MEIISLVVAIVALALALAAMRSIRGYAARVDALEAGARRAAAELEDAESRALRLQQFVAWLAEGRPIDPEMIAEGRLYDEVSSADARALIEEQRPTDLRVLDVRTREEVSGGHIAGALWIPVDEIDSRAKEVPQRGRVLVVCAAGGRSAAACDYLSGRGWTNLTNVNGGMSSYPGEVVTGAPGDAK